MVLANAKRMDDIIVVAQIESDETINDSAITKSVIKISHDGAKYQTLNDILKHVNSLQIQSSGGQGGFSTVSLRGSSPNQVNVYMDGVPLDAVNNSSMNLAQINLGMIDRIEVYRGNAPAYLGANPIGGAINLITRKANGKSNVTTNIYGGIGSFGTWYSRVDLAKNDKNTHYFFNLDRLESKGNYDYIDKRRTSFDLNDDIAKVRQNNSYKRTNVYFKSGKSLKNNRNIEFSQLINFSDKGLSGPGFSQSTNASFKESQHLTRISSTVLNDINEGKKLKFDGYYRTTTSKLRDPLSEIGLGKQDSKNIDRRMGFSLNYGHQLNNHFLTWTARFIDEIYEPKDRFITFNQPTSKRNSFYIGLEDQYYITDSIVVSPSIRYENIVDDFQSVKPGMLSSTEKSSDQKFSWNISGTYNVYDNLILRANVSRNIRFPDLSEIFGDKGGTIGNKSLSLEESTNSDVGLEWTDVENLLFFKKSFFSINLYLNERKNLIQYVFDARGVGRAQNISKGKVKGFELEQHSVLNDLLSFNQSFSSISSKIISSPFKTDLGKQIPGIYKLTYFAKCEFKYQKIKSYLSLYVQEDMFYDKTNLLPAENKEIFDWGISYRFGNKDSNSRFMREGECSFEIKNLGADQVEDFSGWPQPERSFLLSVKL